MADNTWRIADALRPPANRCADKALDGEQRHLRVVGELAGTAEPGYARAAKGALDIGPALELDWGAESVADRPGQHAAHDSLCQVHGSQA